MTNAHGNNGYWFLEAFVDMCGWKGAERAGWPEETWHYKKETTKHDICAIRLLVETADSAN